MHGGHAPSHLRCSVRWPAAEVSGPRRPGATFDRKQQPGRTRGAVEPCPNGCLPALGGRRLAIPYCTLCGSAQACFTDDVEGADEMPVLRTSGLLSRSN